MAGSTKNSLQLSVRTQLVDLQPGDKFPPLNVYVFSSEGTLLASAPAGEKETLLNLEAPASVARLRVVAGPRVDDRQAELGDLLRRGAQEQFLRVDPGSLRHELPFVIYPDIWRCWLRSACIVRGNLYKRVLIGGIYENYPVCDATVEVYEVDPLWIILPKLPDLIIDRLRDIILRPIPFPIPEPIPGPDPAPFARAAMVPVQRQLRAPPTPTSDAVHALAALPQATALRYSAQVASRQQFQQSLLDHAELIRPLLCLYYPRFVTMQRVATAKTDDCGHFQTLFFNGCNNPDQPDLYFKAKQKLFGWLDVYIYAPTPIACHTWWDYHCGTEVNLYTSSPWAHTCAPCPPVIGPPGKNRWVAFLAVGVHGLNNIHGTAQDLVGSVTADNLGLTQDGRPWGGMLLPRLEFSNALEAAGVVYYRMSWRQGSSGTFLPLTGEVHHYYRHDVPTPTGDMPVWSPETLGPVEADDGAGHKIPNLFRIPFPSVAPAGVWDTPPDVAEIQQHFASATSTLGLVSGNRMIVTLHIDNSHCYADIAPPTIGAAQADPCCGVLHYQPSDSVTLGWRALHPHGFAKYSFGVVRGTAYVHSEGWTPVASSTSPLSITVNHLLNDNLPPGCPIDGCAVAGFSENLYVDSMATDGWNSELGYDASAVRAFVLAKS
ncbi:MAG: hypothetical protein HYX64_04325 [Gammaproteobacteria bacterium]|nr:hypothetical protein [Gammaproteobacteria bacterium]